MALAPDDERRLRRHWSLLKAELHVEDFLHEFVELGVFPPHLRNDIANVIPNTPSMKAEKFLHALVASGQQGYRVLCALLRRSPDNRYSRVIEALAIPASVNMDVLTRHNNNNNARRPGDSRPSTAQSSASSGTVNSETGERNRRIKPAQSNDVLPPIARPAHATPAPIAAVAPVPAVAPARPVRPAQQQEEEEETPERRGSIGDATASAASTPAPAPARFHIPDSVKKGGSTVTVGSVSESPEAASAAQGPDETVAAPSGGGGGGKDVSVDMKALEQELVRIAPTIADLFRKIAKQTETTPTSEEDIQKVKEENERLRKTNKSLIDKLNVFQQKIIQLQLDNKRLRESSDVGMVKKKELQKKTNELKEMEKRLSEHKKALEEKEMELNTQLHKLTEIEEENEFQRQKIDKLEELQDEGILERNIQQEQISSLVEEKEKQRDQIDSLEEQQKMGEQRLYRLEERLKMLEQGPPNRPGRSRRVVSPPRNPGSPGHNTFWMNGIVDRSHHATMKFQSDPRKLQGEVRNYSRDLNTTVAAATARDYNQARDLGRRGAAKTGWPLL